MEDKFYRHVNEEYVVPRTWSYTTEESKDNLEMAFSVDIVLVSFIYM